MNVNLEGGELKGTEESEAANGGVLLKKVFFRNSQNSQETTSVRVSFFNKVAGLCLQLY